MDSELIDALRALLEALISRFGPGGTILLIGGFFLAFAARRVYLDWRADRLMNQALAEKERSIQRIADQEREWRVYFMMKDGKMTRREAEKIILRNDASTASESREALEEDHSRRRRRG